MRTSSLAIVVGVVAACHGGRPPADRRPALPPPAAGTCNPSSVITTAACAHRVVPSSNASSKEGCKSDADCKDGIEGRCIESGLRVPDGKMGLRRSNLLAAAPPPIPPTVCSYDQCVANADCGPKGRCACGEGLARDACVALDACLGDKDCGVDMICSCGEVDAANGCTAGNCRSDGDCNGASCRSGPTGRYCATPNDTCKTREDCASKSEDRVCDYERGSRKWECRVVPPRPPG